MAEITAQQVEPEHPGHGLSFRLLGPVQVSRGEDRVVDIGGSKPRLVLVQLLLNPGRMVSTESLVDAVWGEHAPPTARRSLQAHVAKLRAALGGDAGPLRSRPPGYVLDIDERQIDLWRSEQLARDARAALTSDPRLALALARRALAEWTGEPFADLTDHDPLLPHRRRLERHRLGMVELEIDAMLAVGDIIETVDRLETLVIEYPQHEPFWGRLMTAYFRLGRQADALKAFARARTTLSEQLGIDPSPELKRLELAILTQADSIDAVATATCPYKGLASYQLDDADRFSGRDELVSALVEAVRTAQFVVVVGNSGAGKSSVLRAGLASAIRRGDLDGIRHVSVITPGAAPMRSVYEVPRSADVVVVDQFEELFTLTDDETVHREFVRVLLASVNEGIRRAVISVRADYFGHCTRVPELAPLLARRQIVVGALSERELRTAITCPAEREGLVVEDALVDAILAEAADHPGVLPLVSHALVETWQRRTNDRLTLDAYREAGSLAGAIARTAENVYGAFTPDERGQTQRLFLRLIEPGDGSEHARRQVPYGQLEGSSIDRHVIDVLVGARLLTADGDGVEIAHEALIAAWPRLDAWIEDDRDGIRLHRHLTTAASAWTDVGRDEGELYRGVRLSTALSWIGEAAPDLSQMERDFVAASVAQSEKELRQQKRANRRLRVLVVASVVGAIVAASAAVVAVRGTRAANRGRREAEAASLVATVRADPDLSESVKLALAVAADRLASTASTRGLLLDSLMSDSGLVSRGRVGVQPIGDAPISSNGGVVLAQDKNVFGVVLDAATLKPLAPGLRSPTAVVDTGDRIVALTGAGHSDTTTLEIVDPRTGASLGPDRDLRAEATKLALSPDGATLAIADADDETSVGGVTIYDSSSGDELTRLASDGPGSIGHPTFGFDGHLLMATLSESGVVVWDVSTGALDVLAPIGGAPVTRLAASPTGTLLAAGRENGQVDLWSRANASADWVQLDVRARHADDAPVTWLDFDSDGGRVVSTSADEQGVGQVIVWDGASGAVSAGPLRFEGLGAITYFKPGTPNTLVTIDLLGNTWEWEPNRAALRGNAPGINLGSVASSSPDTGIMVSSGSDATVHDLASGHTTTVRFDGLELPIRGLATSADGRRVAVVRQGWRVEVRDAASGNVVFEPQPQMEANEPFQLAIDDDGSRLAYQMPNRQLVIVDSDGSLDVISVAGWRQENIQALDLDSEGDELVFSTASGEAIWYDLRGMGASVVATAGNGFDAQFVADGRVAVVGAQGVQVIDPHGNAKTEGFATGTDGRRLAIDPTGRLLATLDDGGSVHLWDREERLAIGRPLAVSGGAGAARMRFTGDGRYLVLSGQGQTSWFDVSTTDWVAAACRLSDGGQVSSEEIAQILGSNAPEVGCT